MKSRVLIAVFAIWAGAGLPTPMSVQVRSSKVRATPSQLGKAIATVQYHAIVEAGAPQRGWYPVTTKDGKKGYVHASALSTKRITMRAGTLIVAIGVSLDEVALATKENRGSIGQLVAELERRDELDFTWVERMATFGVSDDQIIAFRTEGNLSGGAQ
ncbi:MAG: SH3 domain-containing protein [Phycisphaeraceae bacterium]|nr:SH3 domain-containing protein [Phycisphaeraceae bacterium]